MSPDRHFKTSYRCLMQAMMLVSVSFFSAPALAGTDDADANPAQAPINAAASNDAQYAIPSPAPEAEKPKAAAPKKSAAKGGPDILQQHMGGEQDVFNDALTHLYATHPQLQSQAESLKATDENINIAASGLRPNVSASYGVGRVTTDRESGARAENQALTVNQPVFDGLATFSNFKAAQERVRAAQAQFTALEQQVLLDGITAYAGLVTSQAVLKVNQTNVDLLTQQYQGTRSRFEVGEVTRTDLAQSEARLASAKAGERSALGDLEANQATFKRVIGFDAPSALRLPGAPEGLPQSLEEALRIAGENEPTLAAAQELERARLSDVDALKGALLPTVNVVGQMRRVQNTVGGSQAVSNDSVFLNVTVPLYQSGAEWARIRQAKHLAKQAKYTAMDTKLSVTESVTRAWQLYRAALGVIESAELAVKAASTAIESIRAESRLGSRSILDVLNTQQELFNAQVSLVNARVGERLAAYRLLASIGHLTAGHLALPVSNYDPNLHTDKVKYKLIGF